MNADYHKKEFGKEAELNLAKKPEIEEAPLLEKYITILRVRRQVILVFAGVLVITSLIATAMATRRYSARAVVEVMPVAPKVMNSVEQVEDLGAGTKDIARLYYATQQRIVRSRMVIQGALISLREEHGITEFDQEEDPILALRKKLTLSVCCSALPAHGPCRVSRLTQMYWQFHQLSLNRPMLQTRRRRREQKRQRQNSPKRRSWNRWRRSRSCSICFSAMRKSHPQRMKWCLTSRLNVFCLGAFFENAFSPEGWPENLPK